MMASYSTSCPECQAPLTVPVTFGIASGDLRVVDVHVDREYLREHRLTHRG